MFNRPHHNRIASLLSKLDGDLLLKCNTYFAGGTAIVLEAGEYRESVDVDFLCGTAEGYRMLREAIREKPGLDGLAKGPIELLRDVKTDQYGVRTFAKVDGVPLKIEFVLEGRVPIAGQYSPQLGVPVLCREDMYAEKLLANDDRQGDRQSMHRDAIDLAMMIDRWGGIPDVALAKAVGAYGQAIVSSFAKATQTLSAERDYLAQCVAHMNMDAALVDRIPAVLQAELQRIAPDRARVPPAPPASELIAQDPALGEFIARTGAVVQQGNYEAGHYLGRVAWTGARCCAQDVGRGIVVLHPTEHWHTVPKPGDYVRVRYQHGIADWSNVTREKSQTLAR